MSGARRSSGASSLGPAGGADRDGVRLEVIVHPRARRNEVEVRPDGTVNVWVTAPPVDGAANRAVRDLLARMLGCARSAVEIVRGETGRHKVVRVLGLPAETIGGRLRARPGEP